MPRAVPAVVFVSLLIVLLAVTAWHLSFVLLLAFLGVLMAVLLRHLALILARHTPVSASAGVLVVALALAVLIVLGVMFLGPRLVGQLQQVADMVPRALAQFEALLRYEPLEGGKPADLRLFLSDYATNAPIKGAKLTLTTPEDANLKWAVTEQEPGVYLVEGQFPANKAYSFALNVVAGETADLLLLEGIKVGEKLPVAATAPAAATSLFSSWKTILALVGAFVLGIGLTALLMRRRRQPAEPALQTSEQALTASRRTPFP